MCYDKLIKEIVNNDIDKVVELLVANEAEIRSKMTNFRSYYLFYKVKSKEMISVLLDYFESRNIFDISNILTSIINVAIINGMDIDMIQQLIDKGGNVNSTDMRGISPLLQSVISKRNVSLMKYIIENGANVNEICDDDKNTILHLAVSKFCEDNDDDLERIKLLIDYGADVNTLNQFNELPMTKSSSTTSDDLWFELIKRGTYINERKKYDDKTNILCYALNKKGRSLELIHKLIVMGADVNAVDRVPDTPLVLALKNNYDKDFVVELIRNGASVNTTYVTYDVMNSNPLLMAMELKRSKEIISTLIKYRADVNWVGRYEITPLMFAIKNNYKVDIIDRLIHHGAKINMQDYYGLTPLMHAMKINDKEIIRRLINSGANVNEVDKEGRSCLLYAVMYTTDEEVINLLIDKGADLSQLNKHHDDLLFSIELTKNNSNKYAVKVIENCEVSCQKIFLNYLVRLNMNKRIIFDVICKGADVNAVDESGCTPLINAVINKCDYEVIIKLIESGADVNVKDKDGVSPLAHAAVSSDSKELMKILVNYGANINTQDKNGETILMRMLRSNSKKELISNVIKLEADVNLRNNRDETPLMVAIYSFYEFLIPDLGIITLLIKNGANVNDTNKEGYSPLMYALSNKCCGDDNIFRLLLDCGADLCNYLKNLGNGKVPLIRAAGRNRNVEKVIEVLRYKKDIFEVDRWGNIFLVDLVKLIKYKELALTLFRDHINILKQDSQMINKIVSNAVDIEFMDKLINLFGIDINNVDREGKTPLMYAVIHHRSGSLINTMIEKGAYPKWLDHDLNTPLHFADSEDVIDTLIIYCNADINAKNTFFVTPYEYASHHCTFVQTLKAYIKHLVLISSEESIKESEKYSEYNYHINECKTELDKMKHANIINNLSYYKFCGKLSKNEKKLFSESEDLFNCEKKKDEIREFYIYRSVINMKIKTYKMNMIKRKLLKYLENLIIESTFCLKENEDPNSVHKLHVLNNSDDDRTSYLMSENISLGFDNLYCISKYLSCMQIIKLFLVSMQS
ncbi:uncharacterized protein LOC142333585 [Lycorma delicatula]|uniref:uncharacterized protein LOC142333585 n=1 Tax=Lycorma delicatula TaxID=130591 RepID=UPI003F51983A